MGCGGKAGGEGLQGAGVQLAVLGVPVEQGKRAKKRTVA